MKRIIALAVALLLCATSAFPMWVTGGILTNPANNAVIADTGAISGGGSTYTALVASSAICRVIIAVRNDTNTADVAVQHLFVPANGNLAISIPIDVPPGGRVVLRMGAALTGSVQGSILKDGPA